MKSENKVNLKDRYALKKHTEYKIKEGHLATPFNRFMAFLVDIFIAIILSNALNALLLHPFMGYNKAKAEAASYRSQLVSYNTNTKLYSYDSDENALSDDKYFEKYIKELVLEGSSPINPLYYYYLNYTDKNTNELINKDILKLNVDTLDNDYYVVTSLNDEAKIKDEINQICSDVLMGYATTEENKTYNSFKTYYMNLITDARENLASRNEVKEYQRMYSESLTKAMRKTSSSGILAYVIATAFVFWIVPMVFGKKTFGGMIFKINVCFQDNEKVTHFDMLSRYVMMIPLIFWGIGFASFSDYFASSLLLPFIGNVTYLIPCLVSLLLCLLEMVVIIKNERHQGYYDRSLNHVVVSYNLKQIGLDEKEKN